MSFQSLSVFYDHIKAVVMTSSMLGLGIIPFLKGSLWPEPPVSPQVEVSLGVVMQSSAPGVVSGWEWQECKCECKTQPPELSGIIPSLLWSQSPSLSFIHGDSSAGGLGRCSWLWGMLALQTVQEFPEFCPLV